MTVTTDALEFVRAEPRLEKQLAAFFDDIRDAEPFFHPHPLTAAAARKICAHEGLDLFYVALRSEHVLAYGMLRGWDEGYETPGLGIAVSPSARGCGLAGALIAFLHIAARLRNAKRVRITVEPANEVALALYKNFGYELEMGDDGRYVGFRDL